MLFGLLSFGILAIHILTGSLNELHNKPQVVPPHLDDHFRIISGIPVTPHSWPWQASLYAIIDETYIYACGGSIISQNWILTTAHCFAPIQVFLNESLWSVRVGEEFQGVLTEGTIVREVSKIVIHEKFQSPEREYDIAVLKLGTALEFNEKVQPIHLPKHHYRPSDPKKCYLVGWPHRPGKNPGVTLPGMPLHLISLPIIPRERCAKDYYGSAITEGMFCAGYKSGGKDGCKGDSGRPLMCKLDNRWTVVGILSWGVGCAQPANPGVYTNVSYFLHWIEEQIK